MGRWEPERRENAVAVAHMTFPERLVYPGRRRRNENIRSLATMAEEKESLSLRCSFIIEKEINNFYGIFDDSIFLRQISDCRTRVERERERETFISGGEKDGFPDLQRAHALRVAQPINLARSFSSLRENVTISLRENALLSHFSIR